MFDLAEQRSGITRRLLVGLCGPPGVGKSTVAHTLAGLLGERAVVLGMDGFHLANGTLDSLGLRDVKGAPETFDAHGFVALLRRVRRPAADEIIYAPAYDRSISAGVTGAFEIRPDHKIVLVEGNYLLMDGPWEAVRPLLDVSVYLELDQDVRLRRLIDRHIRFGRTAEAAEEWVQRSDETNARKIEKTKQRADRVLDVEEIPQESTS